MLDRTVVPPFTRSTSFHLIKPEEVVLPNGIPVYFIPGGSQEVLKLECVMPAGRWFEKAPGAAYFTTHLLSRGTQQRSSHEIARVFDQYGAHLELAPGLDFASVSLYALNGKLEPVLHLYQELLNEASFPDRELDQLRDVYLQNLRVNNEKTSYVAAKTFRKNLFGETHPYGREAEEQDIKALHVEALQDHYTDFLHTPVVFVSGRISAENRELLVTILSALRTGHRSAVPVVEATGAAAHMHIEKEGSVQASVRAGKKSIRHHHPDYAGLLFATHILGGYFGSRLMKNIREEKGLTYGIHASLAALQQDSYLVIGADVNKENVGIAFEEIRKELRILRESPVPADELETSRNHFIGSLQAELTTPFAHADKVKNIRMFNLPTDHYQRIIDRVEKCSAEDIMAVSAKHLHEDSICQVSVG